jgi:hypothetical protein
MKGLNAKGIMLVHSLSRMFAWSVKASGLILETPHLLPLWLQMRADAAIERCSRER